MAQNGVTTRPDKTIFSVRAPNATAMWLCLFRGEDEQRHAMVRDAENWICTLQGDLTGARYGYRADGRWAPDEGHWFDPAKLLVDPYAIELDRRFVQAPELAQRGVETAYWVPRAVVQGALQQVPLQLPVFTKGGLIYEINVRAFTMLHPDVPQALRGTVAALGHPAVIAHLSKLAVSAIELMPIIAWIDERHLPPLGLTNAWGYNPVAMMALDPGLCPGGVAELRDAVAALHAAGIGVLLDLVLNHSGESDFEGGVLSLRGLDDSAYARDDVGQLINDTGCGNTLDFAQGWVRQLALNALRHFVRRCGIDGFRFDLAPVLARGPGFDAHAPFFAELAADPLLADRVLIAEPWDIGPGGYQLGNFPATWLEWNDRFRDDVRRFWRGDGTVGAQAKRLAGSSDVFGADCRSINFLAAHDGFTLADTVAYEARDNFANGEDNRDGHGENYSWNNGVEGPSADPAIIAARRTDLRALLMTLFASTGTIMLTAGDEFGRTQHGNNNAYCQDNPIGWINWDSRDRDLESFVAELSRARAARLAAYRTLPEGGGWFHPEGRAMAPADWENTATDGFDFIPPPVSLRPPLKVRRAARVIEG
ncbi:glycogen debranching protein GlgX [Novosphingobium sp.]|uniref:glycogen debranching protein GlgX n=1 Tax=Novosphingobium sp. TaxID=1874826 RepID=UPI0025EC3BE1|nr:glycogen debranching protein GlgX [Novosphingobium sp.]